MVEKMEFLKAVVEIFKESSKFLLDISPYLLFGFLVAGILYILLPESLVIKHLGGGRLAVLKAAIFGIPLPLCSCGVIPVATSLRKRGASKSATLSFFMTTPTTGVDSILATYSLLGALFAIFRPLAALLGGISTGLVFRAIEREKISTPQHIHESRKIKPKEILSYGFGELPRSIGKWVLVGIFIGGVISFAIPEGFVERYMGSETFLGHLTSYVAMLLAGIPMYVCAIGAIPIVASLIAKGMCPGAGLVFLIAGPATNSITITVIGSMFGKRGLLVYMAGTIMIAILLGIIFDLIWNVLGKPIGLITPGGMMLPFHFKLVAGLILVFVIIKSILGGERMKAEEKEAKYKFKVPDMSCVHCKTKIEEALEKIPGISFSVDLDSKLVLVDGELNKSTLNTLKETIESLGYKFEAFGEE